MKKQFLITVLVILLAGANIAVYAQGSDQRETTGNDLSVTPMKSMGQWLGERGITPHLQLDQFYLQNPSAGNDTGHHQAYTLVTVGADFDLGHIIGLSNGSLQFRQLLIPFSHNVGFGTQLNDALVGKAAPYIPKDAHLTLFNYEQKLLDGRLTFDIGKSNARRWFARPLCSSVFGCSNTIVQETAGINPPPYANWGTRAAYQLTPALSGQIGVWRSDTAFPFTNGWNDKDGGLGTTNTLYLLDFKYQTDFDTAAYPATYELMGYYNDGTLTDPYTSTTKDGIYGVYVGAKKTVYRGAGSQSNSPRPMALSLYGSYSGAFASEVTNGLSAQVDVGLDLQGPFRSRPFDSYGLDFRWARLTSSEVRQEKAVYNTMTGEVYPGGKNEYSVSTNANFILTPNFVVSPFVAYVWNTNNFINRASGKKPQDGFVVGFTVHMQLDRMLGLISGRPGHS